MNPFPSVLQPGPLVDRASRDETPSSTNGWSTVSLNGSRRSDMAKSEDFYGSLNRSGRVIHGGIGPSSTKIPEKRGWTTLPVRTHFIDSGPYEIPSQAGNYPFTGIDSVPVSFNSGSGSTMPAPSEHQSSPRPKSSTATGLSCDADLVDLNTGQFSSWKDPRNPYPGYQVQNPSYPLHQTFTETIPFQTNPFDILALDPSHLSQDDHFNDFSSNYTSAQILKTLYPSPFFGSGVFNQMYQQPPFSSSPDQGLGHDSTKNGGQQPEISWEDPVVSMCSLSSGFTQENSSDFVQTAQINSTLSNPFNLQLGAGNRTPSPLQWTTSLSDFSFPGKSRSNNSPQSALTGQVQGHVPLPPASRDNHKASGPITFHTTYSHLADHPLNLPFTSKPLDRLQSKAPSSPNPVRRRKSVPVKLTVTSSESESHPSSHGQRVEDDVTHAALGYSPQKSKGDGLVLLSSHGVEGNVYTAKPSTEQNCISSRDVSERSGDLWLGDPNPNHRVSSAPDLRSVEYDDYIVPNMHQSLTGAREKQVGRVKEIPTTNTQTSSWNSFQNPHQILDSSFLPPQMGWSWPVMSEDCLNNLSHPGEDNVAHVSYLLEEETEKSAVQVAPSEGWGETEGKRANALPWPWISDSTQVSQTEYQQDPSCFEEGPGAQLNLLSEVPQFAQPYDMSAYDQRHQETHPSGSDLDNNYPDQFGVQRPHVNHDDSPAIDDGTISRQRESQGWSTNSKIIVERRSSSDEYCDLDRDACRSALVEDPVLDLLDGRPNILRGSTRDDGDGWTGSDRARGVDPGFGDQGSGSRGLFPTKRHNPISRHFEAGAVTNPTGYPSSHPNLSQLEMGTQGRIVTLAETQEGKTTAEEETDVNAPKSLSENQIEKSNPHVPPLTPLDPDPLTPLSALASTARRFTTGISLDGGVDNDAVEAEFEKARGMRDRRRERWCGDDVALLGYGFGRGI